MFDVTKAVERRLQLMEGTEPREEAIEKLVFVKGTDRPTDSL